MCIENLFRCLSCDCFVYIYQDSILLYTGDAYDIPIGLMNANIKEIKPVNDHSIDIILAGWEYERILTYGQIEENNVKLYGYLFTMNIEE